MKHPLKKIAITLIPLACLIWAVIYTKALADKGGNHGKREPKKANLSILLPSVEIIEAKSGCEQAFVRATGEVFPRYKVVIGSEVKGCVKKVYREFAIGFRVKKGQRLLKIDDTDYKNNLAEAKKNLAAVKLTLLEEERKASQAKEDWKRSGLIGQPQSELVLRIPQVESAKASLRAAKANLNKAKKDLESTIIKAPFDGIVVKTDVGPGSYLSPGSSIATLYSSDFAEVRLPLSSFEWQLLPHEKILETGKWQVEIKSFNGSGKWKGLAVRVERHVEDIRKRALIVSVSNPLYQNQPLMPGSFVSADIPGADFKNILALPAGTMTSKGYIWYVDDEMKLQRFEAKPLFHLNGRIFVSPPGSEKSMKILKYPVSGYLPGMKVQVKESQTRENKI